MTGIFAFGINLANKLSFKKKFTLLALVTLLPLSLGASFLVSLQYHQVELGHGKLEGLTNVTQLTQLDQAVFDARADILSVTGSLPSLSRKLTSGIANATSSFNQQYQDVYLVTGPLQEAAKNLGTTNTIDLATQGLDQFSERMAALREHVAAQSGLALDAEAEGFYLAELYLERLPSVHDYMSRVNAMAQRVLNNEGFTPGTFTQLVALNKRLNELLTLSEKTAKRLFSLESENDYQALAAQVKKLHTNIAELTRTVDSQMIVPDNLGITLSQLANQASQINGEVKRTQEAVRLMQEQILSDKQSNQNDAMIALIVIVGIVVILSLYFLLAIYKAIAINVSAIEASTAKMAAGDLSHELVVKGDDEFSVIAGAFNTMQQSIRVLIGDVRTLSNQVVDASSQVQEVTQSVEQTLSAQQLETHQVASAISQMVASVNSVEASTEEATGITASANSAVDEGQAVISETLEGINHIAKEVTAGATVINQLAEHAADIGKVVDVIREIAEQTNLLALNAAIEAARAGEQGRGFAVVADEVRTLASRTQKSTQEIQTMIELVQSGADQAVATMESGTQKANQGVQQAGQVSETITRLTSSVQDIVTITEQIAAAVSEQKLAATQIDAKTHTIGEGADDALKAAVGASEIGQGLASDAKRLASQIEGFKL